MSNTAKVKIRVIVIDDSPTVRNLLASILSAAGMDCKLVGLPKTLVVRRTQPKHDCAEGDNP